MSPYKVELALEQSSHAAMTMQDFPFNPWNKLPVSVTVICIIVQYKSVTIYFGL